jgi:hypothetical protein
MITTCTRLLRILASTLVPAFTVGCGAGSSFRATRPPPHPLAARAPESIVVLRAIERPAPSLVEVGVVEASSSTHAPTSSGREDASAELRRAAAEHGCETIVVGDPHDALAATSNGTPLYRTHLDARCYVSP